MQVTRSRLLNNSTAPWPKTTLPCLAEPGKNIVIGKPDRLLDDVVPYLATLPGVIAYNPETHTLTFRR